MTTTMNTASVKKKSRRKPAPKGKKVTKKPPKSKKAPKAKTGRRVGVKVSMDDLDDDDEDQFQHEFDEDGYGDAADRERLQKMTEVERETILEDRVDKRKTDHEMWKYRRKIQARERAKQEGGAEKRGQRSSNRSRVSSKSAALNDLLQNKHDRTRKLDELSDADSEPDRKKKRTRTSPGDSSSDEDERRRSADKDGKDDRDFDPGPELNYSDIVKEDADVTTTPLFLRRDILLVLSQSASFARAIEGLFVRVRVPSRGHHPVGSYLLCRIVGVEIGDVYNPTPEIRTNAHLILQSGKQRRAFAMKWISSSHPTRSEFDTFRNRLLEVGLELPTRAEVNELLKKAQEHIIERKSTPTEAEYKAHLANMQVLYPERTNWTARKTDLQLAFDIKNQDLHTALERGNKQEAETLREEVKDLQDKLGHAKRMEAKYTTKPVGSTAQIFQQIALKNQAVNTSMDRLAASRRNQGNSSGIDPYARFDTTGQSYFSIKSGKKTKVGEATAPVKVDERDWRSTLRTWKPNARKRKMNGTAVMQEYDVALPGLDDFVWPPKDEWKRFDESKCAPPGVDAIYAKKEKQKSALPPKAKLVSFEEWNKMRT